MTNIYEKYKNMNKECIAETDDEAIEKLKVNFNAGEVLIKWGNGRVTIIQYSKD